jgi:Ca2+-binding EF-hand superfamily protein
MKQIVRLEELKHQMIFSHFDIDKDGFITSQEFAQALKELGEDYTQEHVDAIVIF